MIVRIAPPEHYDWIAKRAVLVPTAQFGAIESMDDSGRIHGMIGFDSWLPNSVTMSVALDNPASFRGLLQPAFDLIFTGRTLGMDVPSAKRSIALAVVLSTNKRSLALVRHVGFREVHRGRNWWAPDVDLVWHEMRRAECPWIAKECRV